ncbi:MAG: HNH endonuclease signature motif containing protein [Desulfomonile sp.]
MKAQDHYNNYIKSPDWQNKPQRLQAIQRDCGRCVLCDSTEDLEVHHRTYENLGSEKLEDLYTLCRQCHEIVTDMLRRKRYEAVGPLEVTDSKILKYEGKFQSSEEKVLPPFVDTTNAMPDMNRYREVISVHTDFDVSDSRSDAHPVPQRSDCRPSERMDKEDQDDLQQEEENRRRP